MSAVLFQPRLRLRHYGLAVLALVAVADALFFETLGRSLGLSAPLFAALLALGALLYGRRFGRALVAPAAFLLVALLALVETVDLRSLAFALAGLAAFALAASGRWPKGLAGLVALERFLGSLPVAALRTAFHRTRVARRVRQRGAAGPWLDRGWLVWLMPLALALGFVLLLGAGNPVLERWLQRLDPLLLLDLLDLGRILFWLAAAAFVWPFLRPRLPRHKRPAPVPPAQTPGPWVPGPLLWSPLVTGPAAILRALILFNAVFALQTVLDAAYLWGGLALPEGIGYAAYAHRGAYTLIATALLAALFVLVALRPGTLAAADRRIRWLVYLWIGQNVALVLSAMLRLDLYVDVYALTHWRLAAFVWMGIVAAGLVLICVRIAGDRSDRWLVGANLAVLALVFAGSCFVNDDALIARFNVDHSRELSGEGVALDVRHMALLGPAAIPAIDRFLTRVDPNDARPFVAETVVELRDLRDAWAVYPSIVSRDWRRWTFRNHRLSRYLEAHPTPRPTPEPAGPFLPPAGEP